MSVELHASLQPLDASSTPVVRGRNAPRLPRIHSRPADQITICTMAQMVLGRMGRGSWGEQASQGANATAPFLVSD